MQRGLCFLSLFGLLCAAPACIIDTTDDDDGAESGNGTGSATGSTTSSATGSTEGSATGNTEGSGSGTADGGTASDETAAGGACGWGPTGDPSVPEGYVCGGDGEDPSGMVPLACPDGVTLEVGGACGGIEGPGCCDAQGNAWYCGDQGEGPALALIEC